MFPTTYAGDSATKAWDKHVPETQVSFYEIWIKTLLQDELGYKSQSGSNQDYLKNPVNSSTPSWTGIGLPVQIELLALLIYYY